MRYHEIVRRPAAPDTHPLTIDIVVTPAAFDDFQRSMEDREDIRLLARIDYTDRSIVHLGCSSLMARQSIQDAWG